MTETVALVFALYSLAFHDALLREAAGLVAVAGLAWLAVAASANTGASDYVFAGFLVAA